jgi:hypothetical protein
MALESLAKYQIGEKPPATANVSFILSALKQRHYIKLLRSRKFRNLRLLVFQTFLLSNKI